MATTDIRGATVSAADPAIAYTPNPDLAIKAPVRAATTGSNISLSGLQTIDGVSLNAGDRVLVKDQTDQTTNGLYNVATGPWTRTIDAADNSRFSQGLQVLVAQGATNADDVFILTAANPIILGTSSLTFIDRGSAPNVISLVDFGAVGNGVTDDTAAVQAAINYAATLAAAEHYDAMSGNFTLVEGYGARYAISSPLNFGACRNVVFAGGGFIAIGSSWSPTQEMFSVVAGALSIVTGVVLRDVEIDCNALCSGVRFNTTQACGWEGGHIVHAAAGGYALDMDGGNNFFLQVLNPRFEQWNPDDGQADIAADRTSDGILITGTTDAKVIGGFIGTCRYPVNCEFAGANVLFLGTHFVGSTVIPTDAPILTSLVNANAFSSEMRFEACYFDTGIISLQGTGFHHFRNCLHFNLSSKKSPSQTSYFVLTASAPSQPIQLDVLCARLEDNSMPFAQFVASGGNSYAFNIATSNVAGTDWDWRPNPLEKINTGGQALVEAFISQNTTAYVQFGDTGTTTQVSVGSSGNSLAFNADNFLAFFGSGALGVFPNGSSGLGAVGTAWGGLTLKSGGSVTQLTNKSTGVTLNGAVGQIIMNNAAMTSGTTVIFTVANSAVAATDVVLASIAGGVTNEFSYDLRIGSIRAGSFDLVLVQAGGSTLSDAVVINFAVIHAG